MENLQSVLALLLQRLFMVIGFGAVVVVAGFLIWWWFV